MQFKVNVAFINSNEETDVKNSKSKFLQNESTKKN